MRDFGLIGDALKLFGGAAVGIAGDRFKNRRERQSMRRRLYMELARNYNVLCVAVDDVSESDQNDEMSYALSLLPRLIRLEYWEYATTKQDTYIEIPEGGYIRTINNDLRALGNVSGHIRLQNASHLDSAILDFARSKRLDHKLILKYGDKNNLGWRRVQTLQDV